ncbi:MAG: lycopene cyclase domain-containing protein [Deinococcales bacterium]
MTYLQFHFAFTLPPLLLLSLLAVLDLKRGLALSRPDISTRFALSALGVMCLVAFIYTTPWDNYLVASQVWGYGESRVLFTLGYVPFEEYLFFIIQTLLSGLFYYTLLRYFAQQKHDINLNLNLKRNFSQRYLIGLAWLLLSALSFLALSIDRGRYFGLITAWACPIIALQFAYGGDIILRRWRLVLAAHCHTDAISMASGSFGHRHGHLVD